jgi:hypothetical protein
MEIIASSTAPFFCHLLFMSFLYYSFQEGPFSPHDYPKQLDDICGNELAIKVKIQSKNKMANVLNYRNDPKIIQHIKDQIKLEQVGKCSLYHYAHLYIIM